MILHFYTSKHYSSLHIHWTEVAFLPPRSEKRSCDSHMTYLYFIDHVVCDVLFVPVYTKKVFCILSHFLGQRFRTTSQWIVFGAAMNYFTRIHTLFPKWYIISIEFRRFKTGLFNYIRTSMQWLLPAFIILITATL